jgi:hypothetical protein
MASLDQLPPELYTAIFEQFEGTSDERKRAVLALSRAIPHSPVPDDFLFEHIRLTRREQAFLLYRHLRERPRDVARIRCFRYEAWIAYGDHVVNLLSLLDHVEEMSLWFGPDFAPNHLEDIFKHPKTALRILQIRFRP